MCTANSVNYSLNLEIIGWRSLCALLSLLTCLIPWKWLCVTERPFQLPVMLILVLPWVHTLARLRYASGLTEPQCMLPLRYLCEDKPAPRWNCINCSKIDPNLLRDLEECTQIWPGDVMSCFHFLSISIKQLSCPEGCQRNWEQQVSKSWDTNCTMDKFFRQLLRWQAVLSSRDRPCLQSS